MIQEGDSMLTHLFCACVKPRSLKYSHLSFLNHYSECEQAGSGGDSQVKCAHQYSLLNTQTVTSSCNNDSFPLDFSFFYNKCINKPEHSVQGPNLICDFRTGSFFMLN